MARYCSQCNRKIGFFEEDFDGMCKSCFEEKQKQEELRRQEEIRKKQEEFKRQEELRKKELEERKELARIEKQKEKEEEQRRLEEEKRKQEEKMLQEKKYNDFRNKYMNNANALQFYSNLIEKLKSHLFYDMFKTKDEHINYIEDGIILFIKGIICMLPKDFKLRDLEKIDSTQKCLDIIDKNKDILNIGEYLPQIYNYNKDTKESPIVECFDEALYINDMDFLENDIIEKENHRESMRKYYEYAPFGAWLFTEYELIYYWALTFIYNIVLLQYLEKFKKSELNEIYCKLNENIEDLVYINDKIYELYIQLYKSLFDIQFSRQHMSNLILCYTRENISNIIKNYFELALNEKNLDEIIQKFDNSMTIIDKFSVICENVLNTEDFKTYFANEFPQLEEGIIKEQTYFCIINIILNKFNLFNSIDVLSNDNLKKLKDITINIVENIVQEKQFDDAKKERDRILKGDFSKEIEIQKQEVEYSNVRNGYEFEEYVANLYKKLGYTIEEVTKKSGDQRCRCHCI